MKTLPQGKIMKAKKMVPRDTMKKKKMPSGGKKYYA